jgi:DNA-binding XRE family transcriptional regulator
MLSVYPVLAQYMKDHGTTLKELAAVAKLNRLTLCMRLWGIKRWNLTEAVSICCFFNTQDVEQMFHRASLFKIV